MEQTLQEIADRLNLSVMSVSRALQGRAGVSEETRKRIQLAAEEVGYRPNLVARSLLTGRTQTVAVVAAGLLDDFGSALVDALEIQLRVADLQLLPAFHRDEDALAISILRDIDARRVDGLIFVDNGGPGSGVLLEILGNSRMPVVFVTRRDLPELPEKFRENGDIVRFSTSDDYAATRHLLDRGRTRILYIGGGQSRKDESNRLRDFARALSEHGLVNDPLMTIQGVVDAKGVAEAMKRRVRYGKADFDGIVAATDSLAAWGILECRRSGLTIGRRIPEDIAVICAQASALCAVIDPPVTAVGPSIAAIVSRSTERLAKHLDRRSDWTAEAFMSGSSLVQRSSA